MQRLIPSVVSVCLLAMGLTACGGSSNSPLLQPHPTHPPAQKLYFVTDANSNAVTGYPENANGNPNASVSIAGAATGLGFPRRVVLDSSNNIYVANAPGVGAHSITVFAPTANGNVAPARTISGASTGLTGVDGMAFDSGGNLWAANCGACFQSSGSDAILEFAPAATGNVAPATTIAGSNTTLFSPTALTFDGAGNLLVSNAGLSSILIFAPGASGNVAPSSTIAGGNTGINGAECVVVDNSGNIYVCNTGNNSITVYAAGASGNVAPSRTLAGASTGLQGPTTVAFDASGNMYVANSGSNSITVYAPNASGNQAPIRTVTGANTGLVTPIGLAIQP